MLARRVATWAIIVGVAAVFDFAAAHAQGRAVATSNPIAIGIMRDDGLLIPMVTLQGASSSPLSVPGAKDNRSVMAPEASSLEGRPWTLWKSAGGAPTEFRVTGRAIADAGYFFHEAWTTTFKGKPIRRGETAIVKLGLATQGIIVEQPESVVSQPDPASRRVARLITHLTHSGEAQMLQEEPQHALHQRPAELRASTVVRLSKLWRRRSGDSDTYYFEAFKQQGYFPIVSTGWIVVTDGKATSHDVTVMASDDTYKAAVFRSVIGIVPFRGRDLWVIEA